MRIAVTGSIATDHLMTSPAGSPTSSSPTSCDKVSLSFLVDDLVVRRGGVAANIAFGMGKLGLRPVLVGAVGADFADYRSWLERHGVDCESVHVSETCATPPGSSAPPTSDHDQIASFYAGAMSEARDIELAPVAGPARRPRPGAGRRQRPGGDGAAHARSAGTGAYAFAADPSQQLARMDGDEIRQLIDGRRLPVHQRVRGARCIEQKTGLTGERGARAGRVRGSPRSGKTACGSTGRGEPAIQVPVAAGDAPRRPDRRRRRLPGRLLRRPVLGASLERAAQVGCAARDLVWRPSAPRSTSVRPATFLKRLAEAYGDEARPTSLRTCACHGPDPGP